MERVTYEQLLEAGVHFGHLTMKWNPAMAPYIFMKKNGIHIIDLMKTEKMLEDACKFVKQLAKNNKKILFVGTKKQAQEIIKAAAEKVNMPYVTERWLGGMLTNFATIRKSVKKMENLQRMETDGTYDNLSKKEKLMIGREIEKLQKMLGGVADMTHLPAALFIIDVKKEHIAVSEAQKLNIPTIGLVDTNSNPNVVSFPIPGNDDATKSIAIITDAIVNAILDGINERKIEKENTDKTE
ncbi:MAG: 30S ribosomal protein S2 [Candidatus Pacearchaeota archaeon]